MGLPVTIKVNFRGNVKRFVAPDLDKSEWESVETWIKASFGINHFQVKYFDEDNEEISINSQEEYEEAVKSAEKQGNQLHMNVYKMKGPVLGGPLKTEVKELKGDLRPAPPYPSRVKTVDKGTQVTPERDTVVVKVTKPEDEPPPVWFRSYMEKFKDEVVKEVVERMCNDFSGQCCTHKAPDESPETLGAVGGAPAVTSGSKVNSSTALSPGTSVYTPTCSSCKRSTSEGGYQCSVCPSCILCKLCRDSHDPSHNLVRTKTPLSIPEHGMSGESSRFPRRGDRMVRKAERQRLKAEKKQLKAEVKEIKKKLRLEKRGLQSTGTSGPGRSNLAAAAASRAPALAPSLAPPAPATEPAPRLAPGPTPGPDPTPAPGPTQAPEPQASSPEGPIPEVSLHSPLVPTMDALFLDENLPDGTRLEPGNKFIKHWRMRNSGTVRWTSDTKLKFMWGNLTLASEEKREVTVPPLHPGQVGVVSVTFVAPAAEGTYTSHWRLAHRGGQFGPRVWCSIVVDAGTDGQDGGPQNKRPRGDVRPVEEEREAACPSSRDSGLVWSFDRYHRDFYMPSVDLLTAQDLLSFELLDINIVQELEKVPNNTPVDVTPCMSPLPHEGPSLERAGPASTTHHHHAKGHHHLLVGPGGLQGDHPASPAPEDRDEDISGAQFLCEMVMRSLTLEEAPEHRPLCRAPPRPPPRPSPRTPGGSGSSCQRNMEEQEESDGGPEVEGVGGGAPPLPLRRVRRAQCPPPRFAPPQITLQEEEEEEGDTILPDVLLVPLVGALIKEEEDKDEDEEEVKEKKEQKDREEEEEEGEVEEEMRDWDEVSSQASSSASSCDDYIIILPDCFDTSRPLGESMYSSALSQPGTALTGSLGEGLNSEEEEPEDLEDLDRATPEGAGQEGAGEAVPSERERPGQRGEVLLAIPEGEGQDGAEAAPEAPPILHSSVNQMLCASQTLDAVPLTPEVAPPPPPPPPPPPSIPLLPPAGFYTHTRSGGLYVSEPRSQSSGAGQRRPSGVHLTVAGPTRPVGSASAFETYNPRVSGNMHPRGPGGITDGLVRRALSGATSAYKALFTAPSTVQHGIDPASQDASMMAALQEMGFRDPVLNQQLLRKHRYSLLHAVNELVEHADRQGAATPLQHAARGARLPATEGAFTSCIRDL